MLQKSKEKLDTFLYGSKLGNNKLKKFWSEIALTNSFYSKHLPLLSLEKIDNFSLPQIKDDKDNSYLPIEFFKDKDFSSKWNANKNPQKIKMFKSSGTSSKNRSLSYFTRDGLLLYKLSSLKTFRDVLDLFFDEQDVCKIQGYSFIPSTSEWKDSSLSFMLSWISEFLPVEYTTPENLNSIKPSKNRVDSDSIQ